MTDENTQSAEKATQQTTTAQGEAERPQSEDLTGLKNNRDEWKKEALKWKAQVEKTNVEKEKQDKQKMIDEGNTKALLELTQKEKDEISKELRIAKIKIAVAKDLAKPDFIKVFVDEIADDLSNMQEVIAKHREESPELFITATVETKEPPRNPFENRRPASNGGNHVFTRAEIAAGIKTPGWYEKNREAIMFQKKQGLLK